MRDPNQSCINVRAKEKNPSSATSEKERQLENREKYFVYVPMFFFFFKLRRESIRSRINKSRARRLCVALAFQYHRLFFSSRYYERKIREKTEEMRREGGLEEGS